MELLVLLCLLLPWGGGQALVPPSELKQLSAAGSKYIEAEVENAIEGVKRMKSLMERSSKDHQAILSSLGETRRRKEEAVQLAREKEQELAARQEECNATVLALWEQCKPCLRRSCVRLYSRTCHSGSGLVGRQLEELLNHSSPLSLWLPGQRLEQLLEQGRRQEERLEELEELEEGFTLLQDTLGGISQPSPHLHPHLTPFFGGAPLREAFLPPPGQQRLPREPQPGFPQLFQPLFQLAQRMQEEALGGWDQPLWGFFPEPRNSSQERMVCREIRRNSAGCLRLRDQCHQCRDILALGCWEAEEGQGQVREQLEEALRLAERWARRSEELLRSLQAEMLNTTGLLDQLGRQFGWVSRLANLTQGSEEYLQVTTVFSKAPNLGDPSTPPDTQVTVQLFDSEPLVLTVPGDIPWGDPRFMELVAQQALQHYKQNLIE